MDGIILINKPINYTSRDIVNIVSKKLNIKKVGHTGTLDPIATGVLVLCVGSATKLVELLTFTYKEYIAEVTLGIKTDTYDITGKVLETCNVKIDKDTIINTLNKMIGYYDQEVPIYSAVKIDGKKLYEYARNGIDIELPKRNVHIKQLELISDIEYTNNKTIFKIKCLVSKGTYIRSLINDLATNLNTIGVMSSLTRTKQGNFNIEDCNNINDDYKIINIEEALSFIKKIEIDDNLEFKVSNGVPITNTYNLEMVLFKGKKTLAIYKNDNNILKMYKKIY